MLIDLLLSIFIGSYIISQIIVFSLIISDSYIGMIENLRDVVLFIN